MNYSEIRVGIICPLDIEYEACKEVLKLNAETELAGRYISSRKENDIKVVAVKAGVGKINCSSATQLIIDKYCPDFIIDVGVSGSLTNTLKIFDIVCAEYCYEYDPVTGSTLEKESPGEDKSATIISKAIYKKVFKNFADNIKKSMEINIQFGNIACGDKDVKEQNFRQTLQKNFNAVACNWETSAVLHTANINKVKGFSFRVVSDLANENMEDSFSRHCSAALKKMFPVLSDFVFNGWINNFL